MSPFEIASPADIGPDRTLLFWLDTSLMSRAWPHLGIALYWLRETAHSQFGPDLCRSFQLDGAACVEATLSATFLAAVSLDQQGRLRLRLSKWRASSLAVEARPAWDANPNALLRSLFAFDSEAPGRVTMRLADAIYEQVFRALENRCAAELSRLTARGAAIIDRSFDFTPQGLAAFRCALEGQAVQDSLARCLGNERTIEVHLPSLGRAEWPDRWSALAHAEAVAEPDGRVFVHTKPDRAAAKNAGQTALALAAPLLYPQSAGFEIGFTDSRVSTAARLTHSLPHVLRPYDFGPEPWEWLASAPAGEVVASVSLSVPGSLSGAWLRAPGERDSLFFDVYSKVSVAVQRALRRWLPYVYFSDLSRFEDAALAYPLLFYRSTYPCSGRPRSDFAYDLVAPDSPGVARPWAARILATALARAERLLIAGGRRDLARRYRPWRAHDVLDGILLRPRFINELLTNDAFFIDRLVGLGLAGRELASQSGVSARKTARDLAIATADFNAAVNRKLKRVYGGQQAVSLGSLLLVEATRALAVALGGDAAISATVHLQAEGREQTFVNRRTR
jgi:hypothetical protein